MPEYPDLPIPKDPKPVANLTHVARALPRAGLPVGPGRVLVAIEAVAASGITSQRDVYWMLHAILVNRPEQHQVFTQTFRLFWRDPRFMEHMLALMLPAVRGGNADSPTQAAARRAAEALPDGARAPERPPDADCDEGKAQTEIDASRMASAAERLRNLDFKQTGAAEQAEAKRMLARLALPVPPLSTCRLTQAAIGRRPDWRHTLRACLHAFNRDGSRRVMRQGAVVLPITGGLERGDPAHLAREMERLHLSVRRTIWINPLRGGGASRPGRPASAPGCPMSMSSAPAMRWPCVGPWDGRCPTPAIPARRHG